jgi:hypothetical protein
MPAKPTIPTKPHEGAKPRTTDSAVDNHPKELTAPMPAAAIEAALAKKVDLNLADAPLADVVAAIKNQTKLDIRTATDALVDSSGKPTDATPVGTFHLNGVSAASALDLVAHDFAVDWGIDHGAILIAAPDSLPVEVEVYDVRDLVLAQPNANASDERGDFQYEPLIDLITGTVQTPSWSGDVQTIQDCNPFRGTLTIHQDWRTQKRVAGLIAALRKSRDTKFDAAGPELSRGLPAEESDNAPIVAALKAKVDISLHDAKFPEVLAWIRHAGVQVHPDTAAQSTVNDKTTFTLRATGVSLKAVLDQLMAQAKLNYVIQDETLVITTQEAAAQDRTIRVYPVGDLVGADVERVNVDDDYAQLLDIITHNVDPESWATLTRSKTGDAYAAYLVLGRAIVCDQTREAHDSIAATLDDLRSTIGKRPAANEKTAAGESHKRSLPMKVYKLNTDLPAEDFVAVVRELVDPASWNGEAYIHGVPGAIVVKQTPAIHRRIEQMLIALGAIPDPKKSANSVRPISTHKPT